MLAHLGKGRFLQFGSALLLLLVGILPEQCEGLKCYQAKKPKTNEKGEVAAKDFKEEACPDSAKQCYSFFAFTDSITDSSWGCDKNGVTECMKKQGFGLDCYDIKAGDASFENFGRCVGKWVNAAMSRAGTDEEVVEKVDQYRACLCESDLCNSDKRDKTTSGAKSGRPDDTLAMLILISGAVTVGSSRLVGSFTVT